MDNLTNAWKNAKQAITKPSQTAAALIGIASAKKKSILYFQYGNIVVLSVTLILISLYFYVFTFKFLLSKIGIGFMISGLVIRIVIEVISLIKLHNIQLVKDASQTTQDALTYYNYRKKIHGPFTILTVGLYVIGFYFLSPEFSTYFHLKWMILMHISFIAGAVFLVWQIRKGIKKEMENLSNLVSIKKEMNEIPPSS